MSLPWQREPSLERSLFVKEYGERVGYVDLNGERLPFVFVDREVIPTIRERSPDDLDRQMEKDEILRVRLPGEEKRYYYEGEEHHEAVVIWEDLIRMGVDPSKIILINIDEHSDTTEHWRPFAVRDENWIKVLADRNLLHNGYRATSRFPMLGNGVFWLRKEIYLAGASYDAPFFNGVVHANYTVHTRPSSDVCFTMLRLADVESRLETLKEMLSQLRAAGYYVISSIDPDAGDNSVQLAQIPELYVNTPREHKQQLNLASLGLVKVLGQNSDVTFMVKSRRYCDPDFARQQTYLVRRLVRTGFA